MRITGQEVIAVVARDHKRSLEDMRCQRRTRDYVRPRQIAMYLMREICPHLSYPAIGRLMGGRDHTTVLHGFRKIQELMSVDPILQDYVGMKLTQFRAQDPILEARIIAAQRHVECLRAQRFLYEDRYLSELIAA